MSGCKSVTVVLYADKEKTTALLHSVGFQHAYSVERSGSSYMEQSRVSSGGESPQREYNEAVVPAESIAQSEEESKKPLTS